MMDRLEGTRRLSPHFTVSEAIVTSHRGFGQAQRDYFTEQVEAILVAYLGDCWEPAREVVGPMRVLSAVRCPELNRAVGGSPTSWHMVRAGGVLGAATDNVPLGTRLLDAYRTILDSAVPFDEIILEYNSWIHLGWRVGSSQRREALMKFDGSPYLAFNPKDPRLAAA